MARPRVFISSTFYDLRHVRADLERAIKDTGYDPVLNEQGTIPFGVDESLEEACYQEVGISDIIVALVGGRYGAEATDLPYSITQQEIKTALKAGKPVFVFVDRSVLSEYETYKTNIEVKGVRYRFVDDIRIYRFLDEIFALPNNNPITPFETSHDIISYLKEQWAGLFQRLLREHRRIIEYKLIGDIQETARTLNQLVKFLTEERVNKDQAIKDILLSNHPAFHRLKEITKTPYRLFFSNHEEMSVWLAARGFRLLDKEFWTNENIEEWTDSRNKKKTIYLCIDLDIFDEQRNLKIITADHWDDDWISRKEFDTPPDDDEVPF